MKRLLLVFWLFFLSGCGPSPLKERGGEFIKGLSDVQLAAYQKADALKGWLIKELGEGNVQKYLARAYQPTLNTDPRPYKAAARLKDLTEILKDEGGLRVAALVEIVTKSLEKGPVTVEQIRENKAAGEWLDALAEYVSILNTEIGLTADESVKVAMIRYGRDLRPGGEQKIANWVIKYIRPTSDKSV